MPMSNLDPALPASMLQNLQTSMGLTGSWGEENQAAQAVEATGSLGCPSSDPDLKVNPCSRAFSRKPNAKHKKAFEG